MQSESFQRAFIELLESIEKINKYLLSYSLSLYFRVFDQYEINLEITKHRHSYLSTGESPPEVDFQEFGLWDAIFNLGEIYTLYLIEKCKN